MQSNCVWSPGSVGSAARLLPSSNILFLLTGPCDPSAKAAPGHTRPSFLKWLWRICSFAISAAFKNNAKGFLVLTEFLEAVQFLEAAQEHTPFLCSLSNFGKLCENGAGYWMLVNNSVSLKIVWRVTFDVHVIPKQGHREIGRSVSLSFPDWAIII